MIQLTTKPVLNSFLIYLEKKPARFREVILISPFLDFQNPRLKERWRSILNSFQFVRVDVHLVTRQRGTPTHKEMVQIFREEMLLRKPVFLENLHAKVYLALGKEKSGSFGILSSANLTEAAISSNLEASLFIQPPFSGSDLALLDRIQQICRYILRIGRTQKYI